MSIEHQASRTLVKSPPELWAECSDAGSLARHIGEFGEIRITRLEPETSVAWEGEHASGTVQIEPSGWGTRVTLTAQTKALETTDPIPKLADEPAETSITPHQDDEEEPNAEVEETLAEPGLAVEAAADPVEPIGESVEPTGEALEPTGEPVESTGKPVESTGEPVESDPVVEGDSESSPAGGRWKRMMARTRAWFGPRALDPEPTAELVPPPEPMEAQEEAQETVEPPASADEALPPEPDEMPEPGGDVDELQPPEVEPEPDEPPEEPDEPHLDAEAVLSAALDSLGQAHHRPFSRA